jgi:hypothetical protein
LHARTGGRFSGFALGGARSPGLVLVGEPDQFGVERAHQ